MPTQILADCDLPMHECHIPLRRVRWVAVVVNRVAPRVLSSRKQTCLQLTRAMTNEPPFSSTTRSFTVHPGAPFHVTRLDRGQHGVSIAEKAAALFWLTSDDQLLPSVMGMITGCR